MRTSAALICIAAAACLAIALAETPITSAWLTASAPGMGWSDDFTFSLGDGQRELVVEMEKTDERDFFSDPDLYVKANTPPNRTDFDGADTSIDIVHSVTLRHRPAGKFYAKVYAYQNVTTNFKIRVTLYNCIAHNCNAPQGSCDAASGNCTCTAAWNIHPDCSAQLIQVNPGDSIRGELQPKQSAYYQFTIASPAPSAFHVYMDRPPMFAFGFVTLRARQLMPPTEWEGFSSYAQYFETTAQLIIAGQAMAPGTWFASVTADPYLPLVYNFSTVVHQCLGDCNGNGQCDPTTNVCNCNPGYTVEKDCGTRSLPLADGEMVSETLPEHASHYFEIQPVETYLNSPVDLTVFLHPHERHRMDLPPRLYIKYGERPHAFNFDWTSRFPENGSRPTHCTIPRPAIRMGTYFVAVENQEGRPYTYNLTYLVAAFCPSSCVAPACSCSSLGRITCAMGREGYDCTTVVPAGPSGGAGCDEKNYVSVAAFVVCIFLFLGVGTAAGYFIRKRFAKDGPKDVDPQSLQYDNLNR